MSVKVIYKEEAEKNLEGGTSRLVFITICSYAIRSRSVRFSWHVQMWGRKKKSMQNFC
jgi:hypothetical protein